MSSEYLRMQWSQGRSRSIGDKIITIGRDTGTDMPFPDDVLMSRRHARIETTSHGWQVVDLSSTNGTFLNSRRVASGLIRPGDVLQVGAQVFEFSMTAADAGEVATRTPCPTRLQAPRQREVRVRGVAVAINSCPQCAGDSVCRRCDGYGIVGAESYPCLDCGASGRCSGCRSHVSVLDDFCRDLFKQEFNAAEASLRAGLVKTTDTERSHRSGAQTGGALAGAVIGTLLMPGAGTLVGSYVGKWVGEEHGEQSAAAQVRWQQADLLYSQGVLFILQRRPEEARQAWIQALSMNQSLGPARTALKELD
ncbi:FHA domain-containing protein [Fimbriimonas ginsengisoli]|nr:FHA domain-containing protein [Fimbriimonas ginsengisoli]